MVGRRGETPLSPSYSLCKPNKAMALTDEASILRVDLSARVAPPFV